MEALRELIEAWLRNNNSSQAELAERSGVKQNVISRWLNRQVDEASPANLKKIAPTLGLTYEELLRKMGEIPMDPALTDLDPIEQAIRQRTAEMREAVHGTPQQFWTTIIKATFDRAIDGARDMAQLLASAEDTAQAGSADEDSSQRGIDGPRRRQRPIKPREPAFA